jgi:hypothetical protein
MALPDLAELIRAPAALSVPGDIIAGAAAARAFSPRTAGLSAASVCLYWAGMAANDWADRDIDARERPARPVPSGRVSPSAALGIAAGLSAAGLGLAGMAGGRRALAVAVPLTALVWSYDLKLKHTAAGPAAMAACRALDVMLGAAPAREPSAPARAVPHALAVAAHTYTVTALSTREVTGCTPALPRATLAATASLAGAVAAGGLGGGDRLDRGRWRHRPARSGSLAPSTPSGHRAAWLVRAGLAAWYAAGYGRSQLRAAAQPDAANLQTAVGAGITGLPALQGALTARAGSPVTAVAVAMAAPAGRRLARRISPT